MAEFAILVAAVCLLAMVIDHFRVYDLPCQAAWGFTRRFPLGERIEILGQPYKVVGGYMDRDMLRVRRCLRG